MGLDINSKTHPIQLLIQFTLAHYTPILLHFVHYVWYTRTKPHSTSLCQDGMHFRYLHTYILLCTYVSKLLTNMSRMCMKTCERTSYYITCKNVIFKKTHLYIRNISSHSHLMQCFSSPIVPTSIKRWSVFCKTIILCKILSSRFGIVITFKI